MFPRFICACAAEKLELDFNRIFHLLLSRITSDARYHIIGLDLWKCDCPRLSLYNGYFLTASLLHLL